MATACSLVVTCLAVFADLPYWLAHSGACCCSPASTFSCHALTPSGHEFCNWRWWLPESAYFLLQRVPGSISAKGSSGPLGQAGRGVETSVFKQWFGPLVLFLLPNFPHSFIFLQSQGKRNLRCTSPPAIKQQSGKGCPAIRLSHDACNKIAETSVGRKSWTSAFH